MKRYCSGLGAFSPCEKRSECANYVHWLNDPRSEFNICTITGQAFKNYTPRGVPIQAAATRQGQGVLF